MGFFATNWSGISKWVQRRIRLLRQWARQRQTLGARGERAAASFLRKQGYYIVQRQARNLYGEIDLVAVDQQVVVFVEVKTRSSHDAGHPAEAVTAEKQRRLTRIALAYLRHHNLLPHAARFDVVAVTWAANQRRPQIEHYRNAFEPTGKFQMFS